MLILSGTNFKIGTTRIYQNLEFLDNFANFLHSKNPKIILALADSIAKNLHELETILSNQFNNTPDTCYAYTQNMISFYRRSDKNNSINLSCWFSRISVHAWSLGAVTFAVVIRTMEINPTKKNWLKIVYEVRGTCNHISQNIQMNFGPFFFSFLSKCRHMELILGEIELTSIASFRYSVSSSGIFIAKWNGMKCVFFGSVATILVIAPFMRIKMCVWVEWAIQQLNN